MLKNKLYINLVRLFLCLLCIEITSCHKIQSGEGVNVADSSLMVMSFNVRSMDMNESNEQDKWGNRRDACCAMVNSHCPLIIGLQECHKAQSDYLKSKCRGYEAIGRSKDNDPNGSQNTVLYLKDSISVLASGTFWLTDTPNEVSKLEGHYHYRTATWIKASHKSSNTVFYFINTHLDNCGNQFRSLELSFLMDFIQKNCADYPVVMTADWNENDEHSLFNDLYKTFKNARFTASITDRGATFNNFGANTDYLRIDHVFYKGFASCSKFAADRQAWSGHAYISDHYPVYAVFQL